MKAVGSGAVAAAVGGGYGEWSTQWLQTTHHKFELPEWTIPNYRIGFLSDSHLTRPFAMRPALEAVKFILAEKPNLILFGGDFVESSSEGSMDRIHQAFAPLGSSGIPCFGVMGNHDWACNHPEKVIRAAERAGITMLLNSSAVVGGVTVVGVDDLTAEKSDFGFVKNLGDRKNMIVLLHEPDGVDSLSQNGAIMLAGHSHGGQICLPGGVPIHTPQFAKDHIVGFYPNAQIPLFVSRGLGVTGLRIRMFCRPEASIITLNPGKKAAVAV